MAADNPFLAPQEDAEVDAPTPRSEDEERSDVEVDGDCLVVWGGVVKVRRHRDGHFWIKGCGRPFLESLTR